jgi:hypothetical protein
MSEPKFEIGDNLFKLLFFIIFLTALLIGAYFDKTLK